MAFSPTDYKVLSFDIYGTLIDWETGIYEGLLTLYSRLAPSTDPNSTTRPVGSLQSTRHDILTTYTQLEAAIQIEHPTLPYPLVLAEIYKRIASQLSLSPSQEEIHTFSASIGTWPAFPDTVSAMQLLSKHYKLVVLSNVDKTSFSHTLSGPLAGVKFDAVYTAEDIGSYKPDPRNFQYLVENAEKEFGARKEQVLQVAQSLYHDHVPAKKFGMAPSVWIMRGGEGAAMGGKIAELEGEVRLGATFETLGEFAELVGRAFERREI